MNLRPDKYLRYLYIPGLFGTKRTREILSVNPTVQPTREDAKEITASAFIYNANSCIEKQLTQEQIISVPVDPTTVTWVNIDGLVKNNVERISMHFGIHPLLTEDILSINQRPKTDEVEGVLFALLNMLYYNEERHAIEQEQISIVVGQHYVISFQEDATRDVFTPLRDRLRISASKVRQRETDYLLYALLDMIVDNYFVVMEKLSDDIEELEEFLTRRGGTRALVMLNQIRKEQIVLKRNLIPVRDMINSLIKSDSDLLHDNNTKYFRDVYDHIVQAIELSENYRDIMTNLHDLYLNNVNMKMNEAMKVMAIVTSLLAPATVIGGIFGMNFERIPYLHNEYGFWIAVSLMLIIPVFMIIFFKKRGWF